MEIEIEIAYDNVAVIVRSFENILFAVVNIPMVPYKSLHFFWHSLCILQSLFLLTVT